MAKTVDFSVRGNLPYQNRLQLLDLLFWRLVQYGAGREEALVEDGTLPVAAKGIFSNVYEEANQVLERIRLPGEVDVYGRGGDSEDRLYDYRLRKGREDTVFFYPSFVGVSYKASLLEGLLSHERLALSSASLAIAAGGFDPYRIEAIKTINPLNIKTVLNCSAAVIAILAYVGNMSETFGARHHMAQFCSDITDSYEQELGREHIDKEHALLLGDAMQACYSSPIFSASPISITAPSDEK